VGLATLNVIVADAYLDNRGAHLRVDNCEINGRYQRYAGDTGVVAMNVVRAGRRGKK
jgi:hypothetical protein